MLYSFNLDFFAFHRVPHKPPYDDSKFHKCALGKELLPLFYVNTSWTHHPVLRIHQNATGQIIDFRPCNWNFCENNNLECENVSNTRQESTVPASNGVFHKFLINSDGRAIK